MRITPISLTYSRNSAQRRNINFGLIEKENREKIIENLPITSVDPKDLPRYRQWDTDELDKNQGIIVKWGGKDCPRGLIYADLIPTHVEKSCMKVWYNEMDDNYLKTHDGTWEEEGCLDHLEVEENYEYFMNTIRTINKNENPDGTQKEKKASTTSSSSNYDPTYGDNSMKAWELYGGR